MSDYENINWSEALLIEELEKRDARIAELERENEQLVAFRRDVVSTKLFTYVKRWEVGDG